MQSTRSMVYVGCVIALALPSVLARAENGSYSGSGGTFSASTTVGQSISVQSLPLAGTTEALSFQCPISFFGAGTYQWKWTCNAGAIKVASADQTLTLTGSFLSGTMTFSGSGGGRGGHVSYWYQFSGSFSGAVTVNGVSQGATGSVSVLVKTTAQLGSGGAPVTGLSLGWNSAYSPVLVASGGNSRLLEADNITGLNLTSYGAWGSGTGQFESISGLAHDATGNIYIADSTLSRIVRINNMRGADWLQLGSYGVGSLHFSRPAGIAIDNSGKIWVADSGNNRIVRFDDMSGKNWTAFGAQGSGSNQFNAPAAIAFDAQSRIYVADSGNGRLARLDDLTGKNWTTLSTINLSPYAYSLSGAAGVNILPSGKIVVATSSGWMFQFDDMAGANAMVGSWSPSIAGISSDPSGTLFVVGGFTPGLAETLDANGAGFYGGTLGQSPLQANAVLALATSVVPPAVPTISATSIAFGSHNVGEPSPAQSITLSNIGAEPLTLTSLSASADYKLSDNCPTSLAGGGSCTIRVAFDPTVTGSRPATLSLKTTSVHPLLNVALSGTGTAPQAVILPTSVTFIPRQPNSTSTTQSATLTNTGTGPLTIASILTSGDFAVTSNCPRVLSPGEGCTLQITFTPATAGARTGSVTISDDAVPAGATQTIALKGTGAAAQPVITLSPGSLQFPNQQVGYSSAAQTFTLTNGSTANLSVSAPVFATGFKGSSTCGSALAAGKSCNIKVQFAPTSVGLYSGTATIAIGGQPALSSGLSGSAVKSSTPMLAAGPSPLDFGSIQVGDNPSMNIRVQNPTWVAVGLRSTVLSGNAAFSVTANNCPSILGPGASCTVQITLIPPSAATYSGSFTITESSGAKTVIPLTGSATLGGN